MKKHFTTLLNPQKAFEDLSINEDWKNEKPVTFLILIAGILPFVFASLYDILKPAYPREENTPESLIWFSYLMPIVFGTLVFFFIFKYAIPFVMNLIAQSQTEELETLAKARLIVACSLIPRIVLAPLSGINLFSNELVYTILNGVSYASIILILVISFLGARTVFRTDNLNAVFIVSPFVLLTLISQFLYT